MTRVEGLSSLFVEISSDNTINGTTQTKFLTNNRIQEQENKSDILANITRNTLNTVHCIKNTNENIKSRVGKQHKKFPNLILTLITSYRTRGLIFFMYILTNDFLKHKEMLFIRKLKPSLNVQTDSIRAKVFT